ncbi:MAG: hypothetical protein KY464_19090 [Gemmatimonadetes bacterium]|nr:hypothetical protein [Gemmatimonadota bacterium]
MPDSTTTSGRLADAIGEPRGLVRGKFAPVPRSGRRAWLLLWAALAALPRVARTGTHRTGIPAKLVVVGMASNGFTIADPNDTGMLGVVGFDAAAPQLIADFAR